MSLYELIKNYRPVNEQEACDKEQMLLFMEKYQDYLSRDNQIAHFTASIWTVNKERTKTLMVYHNLYDSWAWIGGHADGEEDLCAVAMRELQEETGLTAESWIHLTDIVTTPGFSDELISIYLARGLSSGDSHPDDDEFLDIVKIPFDKAVEMVLSGEIKDGKTQSAILKTAILKQQNKL